MSTHRIDKQKLRPLAYSRLARIGPAGDGGYVVPEDQLADCGWLLSLGLSDNWKFDEDFRRHSPQVRIIASDHTVGPWMFAGRILRCLWKIPGYALLGKQLKLRKYQGRLRDFIGYFSFFKPPNAHLRRRVAGQAREAVDITLREILTSHAPGDRQDVFLKMDIESAEYEVIADIVAHHRRIRCIAAEFHELDQRAGEFNDAMRALAVHFSIIHIHGNNCGPYFEAADFPETVEITMIHNRLLPGEPRFAGASYPRPGLDFPNDARLPDYDLRF